MRRTGRFAALCRTLGTAMHLLAGMRVAVSGRSMEPALRDGDHLLVSRVAYRLAEPRRGDLVFVRSWRGAAGRPECIKRIVGLPHEWIAVRAGRVSLNGRPLHEPYARLASPSLPDLSREAVLLLRSDEYFLLGDNRAWSTDSRTLGPVQRREIAGRAWYRYAPPSRRGRLL